MSDPLGLISNAGGNQPIQQPSQVQKPGGPGGGPSFKDVLMENIAEVNELQQDAAKAIEDFASGKRDDMTNVLMAQRKADEAFKLLMQVRNKVTAAYEEIKQMRV